MEDGKRISEKPYIMLDVGGTQIKGSWSNSGGNLLGDIRYYPAFANEDKSVVFDNFAAIIKEMMMLSKISKPAGLGLAFPGPFDYKNGISFMKGLNKYDSIYGISILDELKVRIPELKNTKFFFVHDIEAFALGVSWFNHQMDFDKILCLCIGTGAGSSFLRNKVPLKDIHDGVPLNGWIYNTPYRDSVIDDYLSIRGIERISLHTIGKVYTGKELYELCRNGNKQALMVYQIFGENLKKAMIPFLETFQPNAVIMGGQISKSFGYFGKEFEAECNRREIKIILEQDTSYRIIQGLLKTMELEGYDAKS